MADYIQTTFFGPKDSLSSGDPDKKILGTEFDIEFGGLSTVVNQKYDTGNVADTAQAQAMILNTVLITPQKLRECLENPSETLNAIVDSLVVRTTNLIVSTGDVAVSQGDLVVQGIGLFGGNLETGGNLIGGGSISGDSLTVTGDVLAEHLVLSADDSSGGVSWITLKDELGADKMDLLSITDSTQIYFRVHEGLAGAETTKNVLAMNRSTAVVNFAQTPSAGGTELVKEDRTITGGTGISGGGSLATDQTVDFDPNSLAARSERLPYNDTLPFYHATSGNPEKVTMQYFKGTETVNTTTNVDYQLDVDTVNKTILVNNADPDTSTLFVHEGEFLVGDWITILVVGDGETTIAPENVNVTISNTTVPAGASWIVPQFGFITLYHYAADEWVLIGPAVEA